MTALKMPASPPHYCADFVTTDTAALALHMHDCDSKRSRFFGLQVVLELAHAVVINRMVTVVLLALGALVLTGIV